MRYKFTKEDRIKSEKRKKEMWAKKWSETPFELLHFFRKKQIILDEQNHKCLLCGQEEVWKGKKLVLQIDHVDGNSKNEKRENCRMLCPNCHSQTDTYCTKNISGEKKRKC